MSDLQSSFLGEDENRQILSKRKIDILAGLIKLRDNIVEKAQEIDLPLEKISMTNKWLDNVYENISIFETNFKKLKKDNKAYLIQAGRLVFENIGKLKTIENWQEFNSFLVDLSNEINFIIILTGREIQSEEFLSYKEETDRTVLDLKNREQELKKYIEDVKIVIEQTKNIKIHDYYDLAAKENQEKSDLNRGLFIFLIILSLTLIWFSLVTKGYFGLSGYDYYFFKGSLVLTSITLITYFLKQSVKYQKMADQCKQTKLELEAFPSYVANLSNEDPLVADLRKELAMKYFGRDVDNKSNDETSNILQDQMKNTTEMVKAAMEVLKKSGNT
jgi:hypothetical protein